MGNCVSVQNHQKLNRKMKRELEMTSLATPLYTLDGYKTLAKCVKCYDGDTVHLCFYYCNDHPRRYSCRLVGIDAPEIKTKDPEEHAAALKARDRLMELILNKIVRVQFGKMDKYGRPLVDVFTKAGENVADRLLREGLVVSYTGGTKIPFSEWNKTIKV